MDSGNAAVGEVIGGYRLERLIGAGSTSQVFLGSHVRLGRKAAIKVLAAQLLDNQDVVSRLLQEARVVNDIRHPNIIDIIDFVETESPRRVALVMEYIEGPSLKALRDFRLSYDQAVGMALQVVEATKAAHGSGVIHRDIKPDNLLLTIDPRIGDGRVPVLKMVDFGIAKLEGGTGGRTAAGTMLGTPAYMAPEQVAGRPAPSTATDVFAVGEVVYELFSGQRAYPATTIHETVRAKLRGEMPKLELPPIPGSDTLLKLITRCLERRPQDRPTLEEVHDVLLNMRASSLRLATIDGETELAMPKALPIEVSGPMESPWQPRPAATIAVPGTTELSAIGPAMNALSNLVHSPNRVSAATTELSDALGNRYTNADPTRPTEMPVVVQGIHLSIPAEASSPTNKILPALTMLLQPIDGPSTNPVGRDLATHPGVLRGEPARLMRDEATSPPTRILPSMIGDEPSSGELSMPDRDMINTIPPQHADLLQPAGFGHQRDDAGDQATRVTHIPIAMSPEPLMVPEPVAPQTSPIKVVVVLVVVAAIAMVALVLLTSR